MNLPQRVECPVFVCDLGGGLVDELESCCGYCQRLAGLAGRAARYCEGTLRATHLNRMDQAVTLVHNRDRNFSVSRGNVELHRSAADSNDGNRSRNLHISGFCYLACDK